MNELHRLKTSRLFGGIAPAAAVSPFSVNDSLRAPPLRPLADRAPARRRKIWELGASLHCSIIGTCLSTSELRQALVKLGVTGAATASDHLIHKQGVTLANQHDARSKLLNKVLDQRHRLIIKQFEGAKTGEEIAGLWRAAIQRGDIPGGYWAVLTHPAATDELVKDAFGEVHMLSHLVGAANRADIRRLAALESENAALEAKIARQQAQLCSSITARDETIRDLNRLLARKIAEEPGGAMDGAAQGSEPATLSKLVADLERRLATESRRRGVAEERLAACSSDLAAERALRTASEKSARALHEELASIEDRLTVASADEDTAMGTALTLEGLVILYVGGRPNQMSHMRVLSERLGADLLNHDGGIEDHGTRLAGLISRCDTVLFPVDCVSHAAMSMVKKLCRQSGKPYLPLRSSGLGSFVAALNRPEVTRMQERQEAKTPPSRPGAGVASSPF